MSNETTQPVEEKSTKTSRSWVKVGVFFSAFGTILFIFAFGFGYFELSKVNMSLAQMVANLQTEVAKTQHDVSALNNSILSLEQSAQKSQDLSVKQEQMISDWQASQKGNLNKWYVAEAEYLVKLANDHAQYTHNVQMAIILLQRADQVLQNMNDPSLLNIRKSITTDIANLQAVPKIDMTNLYLQISALKNQIDQLPLPATPLKNEKSDETAAPLPVDAPWWKIGMHRTWEMLQKIVIVRYNTSNTLPLVMPEEKTFLYQNLHAQLESAIWGLLHRDALVYQNSLARATVWTHQYFDQTQPATKKMLETLQELLKVNIEPPAINLSATLQLFDQFLAQPEQTKAT